MYFRQEGLCAYIWLSTFIFFLAGSSRVLAAMPSVCTKPQTWSCWTSAPSSWKAFRTSSGHPRTTSCVPTSQNRREATCPPGSVSSSFLSALSFGRRTSLVSAVSVLCLCLAFPATSTFQNVGCQGEQACLAKGNIGRNRQWRPTHHAMCASSARCRSWAPCS